MAKQKSATEEPRKRKQMHGMTPIAKKRAFDEFRKLVESEVRLNREEGEAALVMWQFAERPLEDLDKMAISIGVTGGMRGFMSMLLVGFINMRKNAEPHLKMIAHASDLVNDGTITDMEEVQAFLDDDFDPSDYDAHEDDDEDEDDN